MMSKVRVSLNKLCMKFKKKIVFFISSISNNNNYYYYYYKTHNIRLFFVIILYVLNIFLYNIKLVYNSYISRYKNLVII
jgi:hypothetical protein